MLKEKTLYRAQEDFVNLDSARQSKIDSAASDRRSPAPSGQGEEKDRFGKVAASPNSQNLTERGISVSAIKEGTVIDHIHAGQALKIIRLLRLNANENRVTVGLNLKSQSLGLKDIIKVENVFLSEGQAAQIAIFAPSATVNVIENYDVAKKFKVQMPEAVGFVLACANSRCITHVERVPTLFLVEENNGHVILRCKFCEKLFTRDQMHEKHIG